MGLVGGFFTIRLKHMRHIAACNFQMFQSFPQRIGITNKILEVTPPRNSSEPDFAG